MPVHLIQKRNLQHRRKIANQRGIGRHQSDQDIFDFELFENAMSKFQILKDIKHDMHIYGFIQFNIRFCRLNYEKQINILTIN